MDEGVQSPPRSSAFNNRINSLSVSTARFFSSLFVFFGALLSSGLVEVAVRSNRNASPGSEGRKKGAFSGALGGSFGLLRCCRNGQNG